MTDFSSEYFTMNEEQAVEYAKEKLDYFKPDAVLTCKEIGDGNLNYVFRIVDEKNGDSIILKQAGPVARISDEFKVSPDRNRIESDILKIQYDYAPEYTPKTYQYDPIMNCFAMEDLSDYEIMRAALIKHETFPDFADHITTFMAKTLLLTSDVVMNHKDKKALVKSFINPELCEISEDLVYTEPFYDCERNEVFPTTLPFIEKEIWGDQQLQLETAKLKFEFMTNAQSLIHGDLHTGSVFIKKGSTKVIDPEFAFYGPAGYDIGNVVANLIFAYANGQATITDEKEREQFTSYILNTIKDVVDLFKEKFNTLWNQSEKDLVATYDGFQSYYIDNILMDTAAVTGLELCRRIIGLAKVADITSIEQENARKRAEESCLTAAKQFIINRAVFNSGTDFVNQVKQAF
ncbi:S-methyl-5-thioribose kinase [Gracilibacillus salitolerans]|uniref:S-methyl-5-thioribose kinase n=1 Tax=Gracilibacillus salitolerans TaxID=2663022 RepID=A0A5Q2TMT1_9BACI|nr:S-methyl-5-thioribose kinase [Gracilibacillus salitolerans]QGH35412.1 S-methyl-5-thioribose kinase [Gracilibacillus salitolerans]